MNITVVAVGKQKDPSLLRLTSEYCRRLTPFAHIDILEVRDEPNVHTDRMKEVLEVKNREALRALEKIRPSDYVILLDLHGTEWTSEEFSSRLKKWQQKSSRLVFVIAGSLGPGTALTERANIRWKLSDLTFTHLMTRVLVLEQIYRGFMIAAGREYHK